MSVIEHWLVNNGGDTRVIRDRDIDGRLRVYRESGWTIEGPFVPADRLTGAVEEIVWLRAVLGRIAAGHTHSAKLAGEAIDESAARLPDGGR